MKINGLWHCHTCHNANGRCCYRCEKCEHLGVFATGKRPTEHCDRCGRDVPIREL